MRLRGGPGEGRTVVPPQPVTKRKIAETENIIKIFHELASNTATQHEHGKFSWPLYRAVFLFYLFANNLHF